MPKHPLIPLDRQEMKFWLHRPVYEALRSMAMAEDTSMRAVMLRAIQKEVGYRGADPGVRDQAQVALVADREEARRRAEEKERRRVEKLAEAEKYRGEDTLAANGAFSRCIERGMSPQVAEQTVRDQWLGRFPREQWRPPKLDAVVAPPATPATVRKGWQEVSNEMGSLYLKAIRELGMTAAEAEDYTRGEFQSEETASGWEPDALDEETARMSVENEARRGGVQ